MGKASGMFSQKPLLKPLCYQNLAIQTKYISVSQCPPFYFFKNECDASFFPVTGDLPECHDFSGIGESGLAITSASSFRTLGCISLSLMDLCMFMFLEWSQIWSSTVMCWTLFPHSLPWDLGTREVCEEQLSAKTEAKILLSSWAFSMWIITRSPVSFIGIVLTHAIWNRSLSPSILKGPVAEIKNKLPIFICAKVSLLCSSSTTENTISFHTAKKKSTAKKRWGTIYFRSSSCHRLIPCGCFIPLAKPPYNLPGLKGFVWNRHTCEIAGILQVRCMLQWQNLHCMLIFSKDQKLSLNVHNEKSFQVLWELVILP